ncbi:MAG: hypothetical protein AAF438_07670 [Pseudomonadota bacterium]
MKLTWSIHLVGVYCALALTGCGGGSDSGSNIVPPAPVPPTQLQDVSLDLSVQTDLVKRVYGSDSTGRFGVPVAAGLDVDGDGLEDFAMSGMQAAPFGRVGAGQVWLFFGDGTVGGEISTTDVNQQWIVFAGAGNNESTGGEIWIDDVTGDGLGDLIIGRHTYSHTMPDRIGAGALTIISGDAALKTSIGQTFDLGAMPSSLNVFTLIGAQSMDRLGFWMRTGDVTGDNVADVIFGSDQSDLSGNNSGVAFVLQGGSHLQTNATVDLSNTTGSAVDRLILRIDPPQLSTDYHFGATVALADLDQNGQQDLLISAALSRVGGLLLPENASATQGIRNGGNVGGSVFIVWDDNLPPADAWPSNLVLSVDSLPGSMTRIDGAATGSRFVNERFGEDLIGGADYDGDGFTDLYVGDIRGDSVDIGVDSGVGHVFFAAESLKGRNFSLTNPPADVVMSVILGESPGAISADTSIQGDLDGDGLVDLVVASPLADPSGRVDAGTIHVLWGQQGPWPQEIELSRSRRTSHPDFEITDIFGRFGRQSDADQGDTLMYSAAIGDLNNDGLADMVVNEMRGNGSSDNTLDVGNLIVISGAAVPRR